MTKLFISYRRADSRKDAGRIYDRLAEAFGKENVFKDVDNIPLGKDFRGVLREAVAQCQVLLAVIGKQWLEIRDEKTGLRRLDNPADFVRIEIESALQRDSCLVIPVLVDNAAMPTADELPLDLRELAFNNATVVRDDPDFHPDVTRLIKALQAEFGVVIAKPAPASSYDVPAAISQFYQAYDETRWEDARQLLTEIRASGKAPRVFNVDAHEKEVWKAIEAQAREEEYGVLRLMAARKNPTQVWESLQVFWQSYPNYDPDNLARFEPQPPPISTPSPNPFPLAREGELTPPHPSGGRGQGGGVEKQPTLAEILHHWNTATRKILGNDTLFEWCPIPAGKVTLITEDGWRENYIPKGKTGVTLEVQPFWLAKYPITYAQFQPFLDDPQGFKNPQRWEGLAADTDHKKQWGDQNWKMATHPRERVSWYDAMAFSRWLSFKLWETPPQPLPLAREGYKPLDPDTWLIRLPTEAEWQRAAQGDDGRKYPWGNDFDKTRCNTRESGIEKTTPVTQYPQGASLYGVLDMSGNVWEWCLTEYESGDNRNITNSNYRVLRGGSWFFDVNFARAVYRQLNYPFDRSYDRGFRVLCVSPFSLA